MITDQQILEATTLDNADDRFAVRHFSGGPKEFERFLNLAPRTWRLAHVALGGQLSTVAAIFEIAPEPDQ